MQFCRDDDSIACTEHDLYAMDRLAHMGACKDYQQVNSRQKRDAFTNSRQQPFIGEDNNRGNQDEPDWSSPPTIEESVENEWTFVSEYMSLNKTLREMIGHSFDNFLMSCMFRGKDCLNQEYANLYIISN